jgi:uncharacterized protein
MKCPHCDQTLHMSHRDGIEIDYCPECRGVWLDRGELDKIIERSEAWSGSSGGGGGGREPEPRRDDPPAAPQKKKKKSSFVGDLFENFGDFGG